MKLTHSESKSRQQILWWLWFRLLSLRPFSSKQSLCHVFKYIFSILFETINISCFDIDLHCNVIPRQLNPHSLSSLTKYCLLKEMTQVVCISIVIGTSWQKETKRHNLCVFFKQTRIYKKIHRDQWHGHETCLRIADDERQWKALTIEGWIGLSHINNASKTDSVTQDVRAAPTSTADDERLEAGMVFYIILWESTW